MIGITPNTMDSPLNENKEWVWSLVGNIKEEREYGENHEIRKGTKQFSGGTKVYLSCSHWGDGYEQVNVIGKPRHSWDYIQIIMPRKFIENFRMQKVFKPAVLALMKSDKGWGGFWDNTQKSRLDIIGYLHFLAPEEFVKEKEKVLTDGIMYSDVKDYCSKYCQNKYGRNIEELNEVNFNSFIKDINKNLGTKISTIQKLSINLDMIYTQIMERQFIYDNECYVYEFYGNYKEIPEEVNKESNKCTKLHKKKKRKISYKKK